MKRTAISQRSPKQAKREAALGRLKAYLLINRASGVCEICGSIYHLQAAHVVERARLGRDSAGNIIIACGGCHDHYKYVHGLPLSPEEALLLLKEKNEAAGIEPELTGSDL
jgi:5-methylcytosine-specific restriction endonuclease McrA